MLTRVPIRAVVALPIAMLLALSFGTTAFGRTDQTGTQSLTASHKPDAAIQALKSKYTIPGYATFSHSYGTTWYGVGVYNSTGTNQTAAADWQYGCCNEKHAFSISIRNNGSQSDRFKVKATGTGLAGWTIKYFKGTTDVTSAVVAGTFKTPLVAPGGQFVIKAKLSGVDAAETFSGYRLVTVTSAADATKKDTVRYQLHKATWCYC